jgi:hypothetical protein
MTFSKNILICVDSPVLELCGRKTPLSHSCPLLVLGGATSEPHGEIGDPEVNDLSDPQMTSPMQTSVDIAVETTANSRETPDTLDCLIGDETRISTERTTKEDPSRESIIEAAGGISFTESFSREVLKRSDSSISGQSRESTNSTTSADYSTTASSLEAESADYNATSIAGEIESADNNNTASTEETETTDRNTTVAVVETELSHSSTTAEADGNADQNTTAPTESEVADNRTDSSAEHSVTVDHSTIASRGGHDSATNSTSAEEPENSDHSNTDYADVSDDADDSTTRAEEQTKTAHHNTTPSEDTGLFGTLMRFKNKRQGAKCVGPKHMTILVYCTGEDGELGSGHSPTTEDITTASEDTGLFGTLMRFKNKRQRAKCVGPKHTCLLHRRGCGVCGLRQWVQSSRGKTPRCSYTTTTLL